MSEPASITLKESGRDREAAVFQEPPGDGGHESPTQPTDRDWLLVISRLIHQRDGLRRELAELNEAYLRLEADYEEMREMLFAAKGWQR